MRTVFVIGAGANVEIGLPSGNELKMKIAELLDFFWHGREMTKGDDLIYSAIVQYLKENNKYVNEEVRKICDIARNISKAMPLSISIDNFIDAHRGNQQVELCGKLAIVRAILEEEHNCPLYDIFDKNFPQRINQRKVEQLNKSWYPLLFQKITEGCIIDELAVRLNDISFIIFNYDRCFEYYMYNTLMDYYNINHNRAKEIVQRLHVNHPYGTVGDLWENNSNLSFGKRPDSTLLLQLAQKIKTFTETERIDQEKDSSKGIQYLVERADRIIFLGFAYHDQNLELLFKPPGTWKKIDDVSFSNAVTCYGTGYGIIADELQHLCGTIRVRDGRIKTIDISDVTCSKFFHDFSYRLSFKK